MNDIICKCGHDLEWHHSEYGCMFMKKLDGHLFCRCLKTYDDIMRQAGIFEWQCQKCGAILTSRDEHCPCEYEVNNEC